MNLYNIFPTSVAKFELGREFTSEEMQFVTSQSTHTNMGNTTSNNRYVFRDDTMAKLREFAESCLDQYLKTVYVPKHNVKLQVTQSWLNYTKPGQFHHKHSHQNSFVSGVLYLKAARERDKIYFYKDGYEQINLQADNYNLFNSSSWWFEVGSGDLMLFPSSLTHMVQTVEGEERISLAFNSFPVGYIGEETTLTSLHVEGLKFYAQ